MSPAVLITVLALPFLWSALIHALRASIARGAGLSERAERTLLAFMIAPVALALALIALRLAPGASAALPPMQIDFAPFETAAATISGAFRPAPAASFDCLSAAAVTALALYALGALRAVFALIAAQTRLVRIAQTATPAPSDWGDGVFLTDARISPFVGARRRIIAPRTLTETLSHDQVALIIAHERTHLLRGDARLYLLLAWIDAFFWFNPFVRTQTNACRLAAEIACDAAVTAAAPRQRRAYAQALVAALAHTARSGHAPSIAAPRSTGEHRMRLTRILQAHPQRSVHGAYAIAAAALCAAPFAAAQYALAQPAPAPAAQSALSFAIAPLDGRLTSTFGERPDPFTGASRFHNGIDIAAPLGAPIAAPAAGRVTRLERGAAGYGDMLEIDHGQGYVTRYGQLSAFDVSLGDAVAAGQIIARVGQSGRATGPHLHLEVYKDAVVIDPASVLITPTAE